MKSANSLDIDTLSFNLFDQNGVSDGLFNGVWLPLEDVKTNVIFCVYIYIYVQISSEISCTTKSL